MSGPLAGRWEVAPVGDSFDQIDQSDSVNIIVNGHTLPALIDDTVATALLRAGYVSFGVHPKTGQALAPTCMMGVCFGCLCTIDGRPGSQACLEPVRHGLTVEIKSPEHTTASGPAS